MLFQKKVNRALDKLHKESEAARQDMDLQEEGIPLEKNDFLAMVISAFLVFLDRLKRQANAGVLEQKLQVIYISPLKKIQLSLMISLIINFSPEHLLSSGLGFI